MNSIEQLQIIHSYSQYKLRLQSNDFNRTTTFYSIERQLQSNDNIQSNDNFNQTTSIERRSSTVERRKRALQSNDYHRTRITLENV
ncbi:hypothetical protein GJ496_011718 [Pomphorhynchus laevis]|nr:hypothetical protein GJ496_011718 [Pomphorhynchus laevis]